MENDIVFMTLGYIFTRIGILLVIGYLVYRVLRTNSNTVPIQAPRQIAYDRLDTRRYSR
jgi:hypothetical protein